MEPMETEPRRRLQGGCSPGRALNLCMAFHFLLIAVTAVVAISVLGVLNLNLSPDKDHNPPCPLFMGPFQCDDNTSCLKYGHISVCYFVQIAFGTIGFVCLVYFVVQIVRAVFKFDLWFTVILDLVLVLLMGFGCFAVAVTISVGLSITCNNAHEVLSKDKGNKGCDVPIPEDDDNGKGYYSNMIAVQGGAWMCMLFIVMMFVVTIIRLVVFVKRRKTGTPIDMDGTLLSDDFDDKPEDS